MPKKERIYVEPPEEKRDVPRTPSPRPAPTRKRTAPRVAPVVPAVEEPRVQVPAPSVDACPKCGLPRADFASTWVRLRPSLQAMGRSKCPRCGAPVQPY